MTKKDLVKFLKQKVKELKEPEKSYLQEEIKAFKTQPDDLNKLEKLLKSKVKIENPNNILSFFLLGLSDAKPQMQHRYSLGDMPDIDLDFSGDGRDKIKEFLQKKYGEKNCVSIGTYGTLGVKGSVQEVSRAFGIKPTEYLSVSKIVSDDDKDLDVDEIKAKYPQVKSFLDSHPEVAEVLVKLTGMKKSIGCIAGDQKLLSGINISEIDREQDQAVDFLNRQNKIQPNRDFLLIKSGNKRCIELNFDDGTRLVCTPNHLIYTKNRGYVEARNLTQKDEIVCVKV